jgi:F-type H+-transporting ATPase subunit gamma
MAKLKEIRIRIASIKNIRQVTSAMKMVSAAKLKKAQDLILRIAPYDKKLREIVVKLSAADIDHDSPYLMQSDITKTLIVVIGSNNGLCGSFNSNVIKKALSHVLTNYSELAKKGDVYFLPIGKQVEKSLASKGAKFECEENRLMIDLKYEEILRVSRKLMELFITGKYQRIDIAYNKYKNTAVQELMIEQYLPLQKMAAPPKGTVNSSTDYIFEPSKSEIYKSLIPQWLVMQLYRILLDSNAAEHGARMTAMHQATDNATELMKDLQVKYNNARQAAITNEILEITAGAEALKG